MDRKVETRRPISPEYLTAVDDLRPMTTPTDTPSMCECMGWGRLADQYLFEHHRKCKHFNAEAELISIIDQLCEGIEQWAADEDGVHTDCWNAYKEARVKRGHKLVAGEYPDEERIVRRDG